MLRNLQAPPDLEPPAPQLLAVRGCSLITSRWLQVLSYILAEVCSSATLLDDYVRATLNVSHHLLSAWHSIAVAAHRPREQRTSGSSSGWRSVSRDGTVPQTDRVRWEKEATAARHVELVRHLVVMALLQQFLSVPVSGSSDTVLRDLLLRHRRWRQRRAGKGRFTELGDAEGGLVGDDDNNCDGGGPRAPRGRDREESKNNKRPRPHSVDRFGCSSWSTLPSMGQRPDDDCSICDDERCDDNTCSSVDLRLFMRAAVAMNPTACALQLISRCVVCIQSDWSCDCKDGAPPTSPVGFRGPDAGDGGVADNRYFVFVASRDVAACEHSGPCFGNRKFIFVHCERPSCEDVEPSRCSRHCPVVIPPPETAAGTVAPIALVASRRGGGPLLGDGGVWGHVMRSMRQLRLELGRGGLGVPARSGVVACLPSVARPACNAQGRPSFSREGAGRFLLPPLAPNRRCSTEHCMGCGPLPTDARSQRGIDSGEDGSVGESDEGRSSWFIMYSDRCSATGAFFSGAVPSVGRLIAFPSPLTGSSSEPVPVVQPTSNLESVDVPLEQAIFLPPAAGHEVRHTGRPSTEVDEYSKSVMAGHVAFAEEVAARLEFWCARGSPRRCYYDPVVLNSAGDNGDGASGGTDVGARRGSNDTNGCVSEGENAGDWMEETMPLMLLFTQVGTVRFQLLGDTVYCNPRSRGLLITAISEATELVICGTRESRVHRGWHKRCDNGRSDGRAGNGVGRRRTRGESVSGVCGASDLTLSAGVSGGASLHVYYDVAVEVCVCWAQGEVLGDGEKDCQTALEGTSVGNAKGSPYGSRCGQLLSRREQNQRRSERLKTEFRLAHSDRLDALLVDGRNAKPIASVTLVPSTAPGWPTQSATRAVQDTRFIVQSFSHYVAPLLNHLREDKVLMVDMDRTLVDNAIISRNQLAHGFLDNPLWRAQFHMGSSQEEGQADEREALERHCEASGMVSYFVSEDPRCGMRMETVYVRRGVRNLLRRFAVEWGIPLLLVTKSSRSRAEAILRQLLDPEGELFPIDRGRVYTAEFLVNSVPHSGFSSQSMGSCPTSIDGVTDVGAMDAESWREYRRRLCDSRKSTTDVLRVWDQLFSSTEGVAPVHRARSVAVLDDMPQLWSESDWPRTVAVAPYTLDRVDPDEYFSAGGLIASLLLSVLYSKNSVVCPLRMRRFVAGGSGSYGCGTVYGEEATCDFRGGVQGYGPGGERDTVYGEVEIQHEDSTCHTCMSDDTDSLDYCGRLSPPPTPCFVTLEGGGGVSVAGEEGVGDIVVVEEGGLDLPEVSVWNTADVEDVAPL